MDAMVGGVVVDNTSSGPGGTSPWLVVPGASVVVNSLGPSHATVAWTTNLAGEYLMYLPPDRLNTVYANAVIPGAFAPDTVSNTTPLVATDPPSVLQMPPLGLTHYGSIQAEVLASNGTPAPFLVASTALTLHGGTVLSGGGSTNAWGQLNVTAPPSTGPPHRRARQRVEHHIDDRRGGGERHDLRRYRAGASQGLGALFAAPWGWVDSASTNSTYPAGRRDGAGPCAPGSAPPEPWSRSHSRTCRWSAPRPARTGRASSWPMRPWAQADEQMATRAAALSNSTVFGISDGQTRTLSVLNLTGVGVLAREVVAYPSGLPVPGASVQTCPETSGVTLGASGCYTASTNASGESWDPASAGLVSVEADASGYVANTSTIAQACSDCWNELRPIALGEFSFLTGSVRGLPSGLPPTGGRPPASAPPSEGNPVGVCDFTVYADGAGNFVLQAPAGTYNLLVNDSGYTPRFRCP